MEPAKKFDNVYRIRQPPTEKSAPSSTRSKGGKVHVNGAYLIVAAFAGTPVGAVLNHKFGATASSPQAIEERKSHDRVVGELRSTIADRDRELENWRRRAGDLENSKQRLEEHGTRLTTEILRRDEKLDEAVQKAEGLDRRLSQATSIVDGLLETNQDLKARLIERQAKPFFWDHRTPIIFGRPAQALCQDWGDVRPCAIIRLLP